MCGITALYEPSAPPWLEEAVRRMSALVRHRGPNGEGFVFFQLSNTSSLAAFSRRTGLSVLQVLIPYLETLRSSMRMLAHLRP